MSNADEWTCVGYGGGRSDGMPDGSAHTALGSGVVPPPQPTARGKQVGALPGTWWMYTSTGRRLPTAEEARAFGLY